MSVNPHEPATSASPRERLNGWKDIANHLGKGVRTVQRWERDYRMPVHRLGRDGGEIVFAYRDELDAWIAKADRARNEAPPDASRNGEASAAALERPDPNGSPATTSSDGATRGPTGRALGVGSAPAAGPAPAPPVTRPGRRVSLFWILGILLGAAGSLALLVFGRGSAPSQPSDASTTIAPISNPASAEFRGNELAILDGRGDVLWTKRLSAPVVDDLKSDPLNPRRQVHLVDLEGDGSAEVVLKATDVTGVAGPVDVFNADGSTRFTRRLDATVHYGPNAHGPRWLAHRTFLVPPPSGPVELWVSFIPPHEFPTRLDRLDARGQVVSSYWSNGYIDWVGIGRVGAGDVFMVGATNNELRGASLAVFDRDAVRGAAPAEDEVFRCLDCGEGGPKVFLVFPRTCFTSAEGGQPRGSRVTLHGDGRLTVIVEHLTLGAGPASVPAQSHIYYEFDADLRLRSIEVGATFLPQHAYYERDRVIDHPFGQQDLDDLSIVRRWNGERFVTLPRVPLRVAGLGPDSRRTSGRP